MTALSAIRVGERTRRDLYDLAARIRDEHDACAHAMKRGFEHAVAAGRLLIEAKAQAHGQWRQWLGDNVPASERTCQAYMQVARAFVALGGDEANAQRIADLSFRDALQELAFADDDPGHGAISRTYIHEGRKVGKAKTLGKPAGIVRLSEDADVLEDLHIAEGLETALAGMSIGLRPMWAAGSTALMAKFPVLSGVEALTVIVDHDANAAGERAARELEARWLDAGREVRLLRSDDYGDLNDIIAGDAA